ncbi:hypothetical protein TNCT_198201 [Trichonephila clavata]|uniref:Uncharacterized protein n=1 Tax=Trichonephila clavata TaxID=2740835 RepID=A0A8X6L3E3_TRICU|nr:hypothetical protein TNCT_198201 [Trichonephila clavata]
MESIPINITLDHPNGPQRFEQEHDELPNNVGLHSVCSRPLSTHPKIEGIMTKESSTLIGDFVVVTTNKQFYRCQELINSVIGFSNPTDFADYSRFASSSKNPLKKTCLLISTRVSLLPIHD